METRDAAQRWATTWQRSWVRRHAEPIAALYSRDAVYSAAPFREPHLGPDGAMSYLVPVLAEEEQVSAWFGEPIVDGDRAAIQWWASMVEEGTEVTYAGTSILRFDADGLVIDEWDAWDRTEGRLEPRPGWGGAK